MKHLLAVALLALSVGASAGDRVYFNTDVGMVVLTKEPCEFKFNEPSQFKYRAYATEKGHPDHEGCWFLDVVDAAQGPIASVNAFFPEAPNQVYVYNPSMFAPLEAY